MDDFDVPEYKNNSHWLPAAEAADDSNYVCYYDAASLYPSSGKQPPDLALVPNPPSPGGAPSGPLRGPVPALKGRHRVKRFN